MSVFLFGALSVGAAVGVVARLLVARDRGTWTSAIAAGVAGAFVGGALAGMVAGEPFQPTAASLIGAFLGAALLLAAYFRFEAPPAR